MNGDLYSGTERHRGRWLGHERGDAGLAAVGGVAVGVILVMLIWLIVLTVKKDDPVRASSTPQQPVTVTPAAPGPVTTLTVPPSVRDTTAPAPPKAAAGDVRALPAGLFCRDLKAKGYSYVAAIDYWRLHGQPNQMDADRNGIPCETVYSRSDVAAYWNGRQVSGVSPLGAGLFCRDLAARGATYAQAVAYWWYYDRPQRMDADKNGIPCETVYSAATVNAFWFP